MKTLRNESDRQQLLRRVSTLSKDSTPRWGHENAAQLLAHVADPFYFARGETTARPVAGLLRVFPIKQLIVYWLPCSKVRPPREFIHSDGGDYEVGISQLRSVIERFTDAAERAKFPPHPVFGRLSKRAWGVLMWRHLDHHLRQFGV